MFSTGRSSLLIKYYLPYPVIDSIYNRVYLCARRRTFLKGESPKSARQRAWTHNFGGALRAWTHNFGGAFEDSGVETAADYNGDNITFDTDDHCTVKLQLDLRDFDFSTKEGAKFTLTIEYAE